MSTPVFHAAKINGFLRTNRAVLKAYSLLVAMHIMFMTRACANSSCNLAAVTDTAANPAAAIVFRSRYRNRFLARQSMTMHFEQHDAVLQSGVEAGATYFLPVTEESPAGEHKINHQVKRLFDIIIALTALVILSPLLLLISLAVRIDGGPAMFRHRRVGRQSLAFGCLKFRSMSVTAEKDLATYLTANQAAAAEWAMLRKLQHDPRITRLGRVLRTTSLDELPQLLNVLRGEMSLIGPRPVVREELEQHYCVSGQRAYAATPPGITGLWQVSGRSGTSYAERVRLDIAYVNGWSLRQDMMILLRTIPAVLRRKGAV